MISSSILLLSWMIYHLQNFNYKSNSILPFYHILFHSIFFQFYILPQMKSYIHFKFIMVLYLLQVCQYHFGYIYGYLILLIILIHDFLIKLDKLFLFFILYISISWKNILSVLILNLYVWYFELMKNKNIYIISFLGIS